MKIAYSHLVRHIHENPSIEQLSDNLYQLGHEHEILDNVFDIEFTPNRGDCLSIKGLLRDLSAFYTVNSQQVLHNESIDKLEIEFINSSKDICPKLSFLKLEIDKIPNTYKDFLNDYFSDLDIKKNNFFTDVSNYLSYETGQPTHCYDANKIDSKLIFHEIDTNEEFETLLGKKIKLHDKNAVFSMHNKVINLAGVVGGNSTACSSETKSVIVECAYFQPEAIIGKSLKYKIQSDAAHKFERGIDIECHEYVLRRFIKIVSDHAVVKNASIASFDYQKKSDVQIPIDVQKINKIIGIEINESDYINYLERLGFVAKNGFIKVPSFRNDVKSENDLAEEIARVIGYDNIKKEEIIIPKRAISNNNFENKLRYFLIDNGFYEVINSPFVGISSHNSIKVDNPLDSNRQFLRENITDSLLDNLLYNERRQKDSIKLFEISDIYTSNKEVSKKRILSIIASGRAGLNYEDFSKKINKKYLSSLFKEIFPENLLNFQNISRDKLDTKIKNEIVSLEIDISDLPRDILEYYEEFEPQKGFIKYSPISDFPSSYRDLSFSIKNLSDLDKFFFEIQNFESDILKDSFLFDFFENHKNNEIKIGYRFIFQSLSKTLTDKDIDKELKNFIKKITSIESVSIPGL